MIFDQELWTWQQSSQMKLMLRSSAGNAYCRSDILPFAIQSLIRLQIQEPRSFLRVQPALTLDNISQVLWSNASKETLDTNDTKQEQLGHGGLSREIPLEPCHRCIAPSIAISSHASCQHYQQCSGTTL